MVATADSLFQPSLGLRSSMLSHLTIPSQEVYAPPTPITPSLGVASVSDSAVHVLKCYNRLFISSGNSFSWSIRKGVAPQVRVSPSYW